MLRGNKKILAVIIGASVMASTVPCSKVRAGGAGISIENVKVYDENSNNDLDPGDKVEIKLTESFEKNKGFFEYDLLEDGKFGESSKLSWNDDNTVVAITLGNNEDVHFGKDVKIEGYYYNGFSINIPESFEKTEVELPEVTAEKQSATNASGQTVSVSSSKAGGHVYIIKDGEKITDKERAYRSLMELAVSSKKGATARASEEAGQAVTISTKGLDAGTYYAYAVDEEQTVSEKGKNPITISEAVVEPPVINELTIQELKNTDMSMEAASNKSGTIYWAVLKITDETPSKEDILAGNINGKKGEEGYTEINEKEQIDVSGLEKNTQYKAYAIIKDDEGNVSDIKTLEFKTDNLGVKSVKAYDQNDNDELDSGDRIEIQFNRKLNLEEKDTLDHCSFFNRTNPILTQYGTLGDKSIHELEEDSLSWSITLSKGENVSLGDTIEAHNNSFDISFDIPQSLEKIEVQLPEVTAEKQSATNAAGQTVSVSSSKTGGHVYIIKDGEEVTDKASMDALVTLKKAACIAGSATAGQAVSLSTEGLNAGTYYAYAVDGEGNVSEKGENAIIISAADVEAPVINKLEVNGTEDNRASIGAVPSKDGKIYWAILESSLPAPSKEGILSGSVGETNGSKDCDKLLGGTLRAAITIEGLDSEKLYKVYAILKDLDGNESDIKSTEVFQPKQLTMKIEIIDVNANGDLDKGDKAEIVFNKNLRKSAKDEFEKLKFSNMTEQKYNVFGTEAIAEWKDNPLIYSITLSEDENASEGNLVVLTDKENHFVTTFTVPDIVENVQLPKVAAEKQSATNTSGQTVSVSSSKAGGHVYIIKDGEEVTDKASMDALVTLKKAACIEGSATTGQSVAISTEGLNAGTYYAYAVDGEGNVSEKGENPITISEAVVEAPVINELEIKVKDDNEIYIQVAPSEPGKIYWVALESSLTAPSREDILSGNIGEASGSKDCNKGQEGITIEGLYSDKLYKVYVLVKDLDGNESDIKSTDAVEPKKLSISVKMHDVNNNDDLDKGDNFEMVFNRNLTKEEKIFFEKAGFSNSTQKQYEAFGNKPMRKWEEGLAAYSITLVEGENTSLGDTIEAYYGPNGLRFDMPKSFEKDEDEGAQVLLQSMHGEIVDVNKNSELDKGDKFKIVFNRNLTKAEKNYLQKLNFANRTASQYEAFGKPIVKEWEDDSLSYSITLAEGENASLGDDIEAYYIDANNKTNSTILSIPDFFREVEDDMPVIKDLQVVSSCDNAVYVDLEPNKPVEVYLTAVEDSMPAPTKEDILSKKMEIGGILDWSRRERRFWIKGLEKHKSYKVYAVAKDHYGNESEVRATEVFETRDLQINLVNVIDINQNSSLDKGDKVKVQFNRKLSSKEKNNFETCSFYNETIEDYEAFGTKPMQEWEEDLLSYSITLSEGENVSLGDNVEAYYESFDIYFDMPQSFEKAEVKFPEVKAEKQSATNAAGQTVSVSSSKAGGHVYIIKYGEAVKDKASMDALVKLKKAACIEGSDTAGQAVAISTEGLNAGTYYAYAVDGEGNVSKNGGNPITISAADVEAPVINDLYIQTYENDRAYVHLKSNESVKVYWTAVETSMIAPTKEDVLLGNIGISGTTNCNKEDFLEMRGLKKDKLYKIYVVLEDTSGNKSEVSSTEMFETKEPEINLISAIDVNKNGILDKGDKVKIQFNRGLTLAEKNNFKIFRFYNETTEGYEAFGAELSKKWEEDSSTYSITLSEDENVSLGDNVEAYYEGSNIHFSIPKSFEKAEVKLPEVTSNKQSATNAKGQIVSVSSSKSGGYVYIIKDGEEVKDKASMDALVTLKKAACIEGSATAGQAVSLSTEGLNAGTYYAYAVDGEGNVSEKGENPISIKNKAESGSDHKSSHKNHKEDEKEDIDTSKNKKPVKYIVIANDGEKVTNTREINLLLHSYNKNSKIQYVMISNDNGFKDAKWVKYTPELKWTLEQGNGNKNIFVKFKDSDENITEPISIEMELKLDEKIDSKVDEKQENSILSLTKKSGFKYTEGEWTNEDVHFQFKNTEKILEGQYQYSLDGGETWKNSKNGDINEEGIIIIKYKSIDEEGKEVFNEAIVKLDQTPPEGDFDIEF